MCVVVFSFKKVLDCSSLFLDFSKKGLVFSVDAGEEHA